MDHTLIWPVTVVWLIAVYTHLTSGLTDYRNKSELMQANYTWAEAQKICSAGIRQSEIVKNCEISSADLKQKIDDCSSDVMLSGMTVWIGIILKNIASVCIEQVIQSTPVNQSLPENILVGLCAHSCGDNGHCLLGECACDPGFAGRKCELSYKTMPTVYAKRLMCDVGHFDCQSVVIEGEDFFKSDKLSCLLTYTEESSLKQLVLPAVDGSQFHVQCPTPVKGKVTIRVANDGATGSFGSLELTSYNSTCQTCLNDPQEQAITCEIKTNTCLIMNTCFEELATDPADSCNFCSSINSTTRWTRNADEKCQHHDNNVWIIVGALCMILTLIGGVALVLLLIWKHNHCKSYNLPKAQASLDVEMSVFAISTSAAGLVAFKG